MNPPYDLRQTPTSEVTTSIIDRMPATVVIADYDPEWPLRFEAAKLTISQAVGPLLLSIEHIGSTAVPGLKRFEDGLASVAPLEALGYEYHGENGIPGRHYFDHFDKGGAQGTGIQHVHMLVVGSEEWTRHIVFRDYLRENSEEAEKYAQLKQSLAEQYGQDREAYTEGKTAFVERALARARTTERSPAP